MVMNSTAQAAYLAEDPGDTERERDQADVERRVGDVGHSTPQRRGTVTGQPHADADEDRDADDERSESEREVLCLGGSVDFADR
jgi:hypothetical protein